MLKSGIDIVLDTSANSDDEAFTAQQNLDIEVEGKNWVTASELASHLHQKMLVRGDIQAAINYARQSTAYAHLSGNTCYLQRNLKVLNGLLQQA
ncbi:MAG: hypothetical protein QJT81_03760 [Candidatus Thiothrix putei]|uniref:Uncharacterized protein n=1 Tax=Candidatus Thiothrix putei TaxID=3080811 RepID=A0AA95KQF9_9GAMM|nr:MAG: hypothetical protein QJT81_03760 [Candidatus Thiothrix putei]